MGSVPSITIDRFRGMNKSKDILSLLPGQLSVNYNYLYMATGGLEERGGGALMSNPPAAGALYSLATFRGNSGTDWLITNQGTLVYYYKTIAPAGWTTVGATVTTSKKTKWAQAGLGANRALYGVNGTDSVIKVVEAGGVPAGSAVTGSPTACTEIILHKNRLFALAGDTLSFTESLAFDNWNTNVNSIQIAPGRDGIGKALAVWGDSLFIFKEYGIYVLPNASDINPVLNWVILRTDASIGTQSPDSVQTTTKGIFYLGTDCNVRMCGPATTYSTNEYTLGDSGSPIIGQELIDEIQEEIDRDKLANASAVFFNNLYILNWQSTSAATDYNDRCFFADVEKWQESKGIPQAQPYWGEFTGFHFQFFTQQIVSGRNKLLGVRGVSTIGATYETLNNTIHNDAGEAIDAYAVLGWIAPNGDSSYKNFKQIYIVADTENWNINVKLASYKYRQSLPTEGEGITRVYSTQELAGVGIVGSAVVGSSICGNIGVSSNRMRFSLKGYYFKIEFRNSNADEFTRINKTILYYRVIKNK